MLDLLASCVGVLRYRTWWNIYFHPTCAIYWYCAKVQIRCFMKSLCEIGSDSIQSETTDISGHLLHGWFKSEHETVHVFPLATQGVGNSGCAIWIYLGTRYIAQSLELLSMPESAAIIKIMVTFESIHIYMIDHDSISKPVWRNDATVTFLITWTNCCYFSTHHFDSNSHPKRCILHCFVLTVFAANSLSIYIGWTVVMATDPSDRSGEWLLRFSILRTSHIIISHCWLNPVTTPNISKTIRHLSLVPAHDNLYKLSHEIVFACNHSSWTKCCTPPLPTWSWSAWKRPHKCQVPLRLEELNFSGTRMIPNSIRIARLPFCPENVRMLIRWN